MTPQDLEADIQFVVMTALSRPNANVSYKLMAAVAFVYVRFSNQTLATLWRHFAFKGYQREKTQKIAL